MKTIHITREQTNYVEVELDLTDFDLNEMKKNSNIYSDDYWAIEDYIESLINGDVTTDEEIEFAEYYKEMEEEAYGMPNQSIDTTIKIIN